MRNSVRKFVGVALVGLLGALALPMLAAGAQDSSGHGSAAQSPSRRPPPCPRERRSSISGTAPDGVTVVLFVDGILAQKNAASDVVQVVVSGVADGSVDPALHPDGNGHALRSTSPRTTAIRTPRCVPTTLAGPSSP